MQNNKVLLITILVLFISKTTVSAQKKSGFYINWDINHTETDVRPSIPISEEEAKNINCYYVAFDDQDKFQSVKFYFSGHPSEFSNYGAHELVRTYSDGFYVDKFKDINGDFVASSGITSKQYTLNKNGHWIKKEHFSDDQLMKSGVAYSQVIRNAKGEILREIQFSSKGDTIPDGNGFKVVHFSYDENGLTKYRQNRNNEGEIKNGENGYATVIFQFTQHGMFFEEQFLNDEGELFLHPAFDLAKINLREFNQYGKPHRVYYIDEMGYPHTNRAYGVITYRPNMTRESITYFDRIGQPTVDTNGIAKSVYNYSPQGQYLGRTHYGLDDQVIQ